MSTHAIIVFSDNYHTLDADENIDKSISKDFDYIKKGYQIYINSNGYPSNILSLLQEYLQTPAAKSRRRDESYLSAWFVAYYAIFHQLSICSAISKADSLFKTGKQHDYIENYEPSLDDFKQVDDVFGIGLINNLEYCANYYYVVTRDAFQSFNIWIYDSQKKFIDFINSETDLEILQKEEWWY